MKKITQIRYYGDGNAQNRPEGLKTEDLTRKNVLENYSSITQIGIQARPGAEFILNNSRYSIVMGDTGIYELDLTNSGTIDSIQFIETAIQIYNNPGNTDRLLIDIVYEG